MGTVVIMIQSRAHCGCAGKGDGWHWMRRDEPQTSSCTNLNKQWTARDFSTSPQRVQRGISEESKLREGGHGE
jgi:hypothetical protein